MLLKVALAKDMQQKCTIFPMELFKTVFMVKFQQIKKLGRSSVLTAEQEKELNDYVLEMSKLFYRLTRQQIMKLAFQYATVNDIPNNFNKEKKNCGKDCYYGFLCRNENISLRNPEPTLLNRIKGFNAKEVAAFFLILQKNMKTSNFYQTEYTTLTELVSLMYMFLDEYWLPKAKSKLGCLPVVKEVSW